MIPKIIHYVWVGDKKKPELVINCINSWKTHLPDYEIKEWGNDSVEGINSSYVNEVIEMKKWAFLSDYLRLEILYKYGGFYFDTDLEVTKSLDSFLGYDFISGFEDFGTSEIAYPITALMAAKPYSPLIKNLLDDYTGEHFILNNGDLNLKTNTKRITENFEKNFNLPKKLDPLSTLTLKDKHVIFPSYYFSTPLNDKPNYSIHHFNGSWHENFIRTTLIRLFGFKLAYFKRIDNQKPFNFHHYGNEQLVKILYENKNLSFCLIKRRLCYKQSSEHISNKG